MKRNSRYLFELENIDKSYFAILQLTEDVSLEAFDSKEERDIFVLNNSNAKRCSREFAKKFIELARSEIVNFKKG